MYSPPLLHIIAIFLFLATPSTAGTSHGTHTCPLDDNECPLSSNKDNNTADKLSIAANDYSRNTFYCHHSGADLHGHHLPTQPNPLDCYKASRLMPTEPDPETITFSYLPEDEEGFHVPNEWSYGTCTVSLELIPDFVDGIAPWHRLYAATLQLLKTCVIKGPRVEAGGRVIVGFGSGLQVAVQKREVGSGPQDCRIL